ncbi:DUF29 family protein [Gloeothece verrucosa]
MIDKTQISQKSSIQKTPGVCGGNARIRDTRIPVWTLVSFREQGVSEEELLKNYPELNQEDLEAAWTYYANNKAEIAQIIEAEHSKSLYDSDFNLWVEETVKQLQAKNYEMIDWDNLIEEVADLSRSEKRALKSLLTRLLEHLLLIAYWDSERDYNLGHWAGEIQNFRNDILELLATSPSLKPYLIEVFDDCYQNARKFVIKKTRLAPKVFPTEAIATVEQALDEDWLPIGSHE